jgi:hypothetical protein
MRSCLILLHILHLRRLDIVFATSISPCIQVPLGLPGSLRLACGYGIQVGPSIALWFEPVANERIFGRHVFFNASTV